MNEWKKALVKPLFRALHFLDLMCLMGCEYRMELAGLLGVMGWEITVPSSGRNPPGSFPVPSPARPLWARPACVVVHTWSAAHSWESACRLVSHTRHPSDSPGLWRLPHLAWPAEARRAAKASLLACQTATSEDYLCCPPMFLTPRGTQEVSEHPVFWG